MSVYHRNNVLNSEYIDWNEVDVSATDSYIEVMLEHIPEHSYIVLMWDDVIPLLKEVFCFNGGDEDWLVIAHKKIDNWTPRWLDYIDTCDEPDEYDMGHYYVWVGSHG